MVTVVSSRPPEFGFNLSRSVSFYLLKSVLVGNPDWVTGEVSKWMCMLSHPKLFDFGL